MTDLLDKGELPEHRSRLLELRANCAVAQGNLKQAIADLSLALEADSTRYSLHATRAALYNSMGVVERAYEDYEKFVEKANPDNQNVPQALFTLAMLSMRLHKGTEVSQSWFAKAKEAEKRAEYLYGKSPQVSEIEKMTEQLLSTTNASGGPVSILEQATRMFEQVQKSGKGGEGMRRLLQMWRRAGISNAAVQGLLPSGLVNPNGLCARCGSDGDKKTGEKLKQCGRCNSVLYCSRECQMAHWEVHKSECKFLNNLNDMVANTLGKDFENWYI